MPRRKSRARKKSSVKKSTATGGVPKTEKGLFSPNSPDFWLQSFELYSCDLCDYIGISSDFKTRAEIIDHLEKKHDDVTPPYQDFFSNQK